MKDPNEKPVSNILYNISRDPKKNEKKNTGFAEISLISDPHGEIHYGNIPEGNYDLKITPLSNLEELFFLGGQNQNIKVEKDKIHYLPLTESYKIKGRVNVDRDPNSNYGTVNLEGIRITAETESGGSYSTLTGPGGFYVLNLPQGNIYRVRVYNVFGERFTTVQDEYEVQFTDNNKIINIDFEFRERRRQIRFDEGEQLFDFKIDRD